MSERHDKNRTAEAGRRRAVRGRRRRRAGRCPPETASLLGLIDRLGALLERSDLVELEVEAGETGIVLRKPAGAGARAGRAAAGPAGAAAAAGAPAPPPAEAAPVSTAKVVKAPLTGIFYAASSPTSPPYVTVGPARRRSGRSSA